MGLAVNNAAVDIPNSTERLATKQVVGISNSYTHANLAEIWVRIPLRNGDLNVAARFDSIDCFNDGGNPLLDS
jgi:hypothetical protein